MNTVDEVEEITREKLSKLSNSALIDTCIELMDIRIDDLCKVNDLKKENRELKEESLEYRDERNAYKSKYTVLKNGDSSMEIKVLTENKEENKKKVTEA